MSVKRYAIMFAKDLSGRITEVVGSDQYIQIDGRLSSVNAHRRASEHCLKRGYEGYRMWRGDLLRGRYTSAYQNISGSDAEVVSWHDREYVG
jgi:hypothetical protein